MIHRLYLYYSGLLKENADKSSEIDEKSIPVKNLKYVKGIENNKIPLFETLKENHDFPPKFQKYRPVTCAYELIKRNLGSRKKQSFGNSSIDQPSFDNGWLKKSEIRKDYIWKDLYESLKNLDSEEKFESPSRPEEKGTPFDAEGKIKIPQTPTEKRADESLDIVEPILVEDSENVEMEDDEDPLFEIIKENERQFSFDDPSLKKTPKPSETQVPKKYLPMSDKPIKENARGVETRSGRSKRSASDCKFSRYEKLDDDGDVVLEWDPSHDEEVTFRVTGKTTGYVGIGFNDKSSMKGADILLAWVDDHTGVANALVSRWLFYLNSSRRSLIDGKMTVPAIHSIDRS